MRAIHYGVVAVLLAGGTTHGQQPGDVLQAYLPGGILMEFRWIPPGSTAIGTTAAQERLLRAAGLSRRATTGEQPVHTYVTLTGFYLGAQEVTQAQWVAVMNTVPWARYAPYVPDGPAICISWHMANAFVARLNRAMGDAVYRLPTEEEWEYAARAGTASIWFFGDDPDSLAEYAWVHDNSLAADLRRPFAVGQKRPNPWGLQDVYGNVREWCANRPEVYVPDDFVGPPRTTGYDYMATRGGSRDSMPAGARSAARGVAVPTNAYNLLQGFRILRDKQVHHLRDAAE